MKKDNLPAKAVIKYISEPDHCPFCGSDDIEGDRMEIMGTSAYQPIKCNKCGKKWDDIYKLTGIFLRETD